jgi:hypothetical protein
VSSRSPIDALRENPLPEGTLSRYYKGKTPGNHMRNFFECLVSREQPISDVHTHHRAMTTCHLANIAIRLGRSLRWDPQSEQIVGDDFDFSLGYSFAYIRRHSFYGGLGDVVTDPDDPGFDPAELDPRAVYFLLTSLVVPRPIAHVVEVVLRPAERTQDRPDDLEDLRRVSPVDYLKDVRVRYEWNDELGPVMTNAEHRSNNPGVRRAAREAREERARTAAATSPGARASKTSAFDAMSREQLRRQLGITEGLPESQWRTDYLARLRARLAEIG